MPKSKTDKMIEALAEASAPSGSTPGHTIKTLIEDQPEVEEAIIKARVEQKLSAVHIARILSSATGTRVGDTAVKNWLATKGVR